LLTGWRKNILVEETVSFIKPYNRPPLTVYVGFILDNQDSFDLAAFSNKMNP